MPIQQTATEESVNGSTTTTTTTTRTKTKTPIKIGWSIDHDSILSVANDARKNERALSQSSLDEVHMSHKQITDRFVELLDLFENYTKIVESNRKDENSGAEVSGLKRTKSEQLIHKEDPNDLTKSSTSLMQLSDCTLVGIRKPVTNEISCQTSWTLLENHNRLKPKIKRIIEAPTGAADLSSLNQTKSSKSQQHTIHIEVASVSSTTALQRAPLRQRFWHIVVQAGEALMACTFMIGENFTYILFILLCIWCLYLVIGHYYSFLQDNVNRQSTRPIHLNRESRILNQPT